MVVLVDVLVVVVVALVVVVKVILMVEVVVVLVVVEQSEGVTVTPELVIIEDAIILILSITQRPDKD